MGIWHELNAATKGNDGGQATCHTKHNQTRIISESRCVHSRCGGLKFRIRIRYNKCAPPFPINILISHIFLSDGLPHIPFEVVSAHAHTHICWLHTKRRVCDLSCVAVYMTPWVTYTLSAFSQQIHMYCLVHCTVRHGARCILHIYRAIARGVKRHCLEREREKTGERKRKTTPLMPSLLFLKKAAGISRVRAWRVWLELLVVHSLSYYFSVRIFQPYSSQPTVNSTTLQAAHTLRQVSCSSGHQRTIQSCWYTVCGTVMCTLLCVFHWHHCCAVVYVCSRSATVCCMKWLQ